MNKQKLIAKTFAGLEDLLVKELEAIGAEDIEKGNRMVTFSGDKEMMYRANFCLRTAVKVLRPIRQFKADDADKVYEEVKKIEWSDYMDDDNTFIVDAVVFSDDFRHSRFAAYRVKDAIADYFREKTGRRPNVGISNPDLRINLHISDNDVTISLDSSGESLHQRGYRTGSVQAPLNEVLAAAIIMFTGWDGQTDFIDPMCGSGTILIEAALIARNIYPGVFRKEFAFERWKDFDPDLFDKIYNDDSQEREFHHHIYGYDINRHAVSIAQENAKSAGVSDIVSVAQQDFRDFEQPAEPAIIVTNPPYGERITTDDILGLYEDIGRTLKHSFVGGDAWILSLHEECFARIGFRPSTRIVLYNGALECELRKYQVFEGKLSERREEGLDIKSAEDRARNRLFKGRKTERLERTHHDDTEPIDEEEAEMAELTRPIKHLDRKSFKWGDRDERTRTNSFRRDDDDSHYFKSRPYDSKPRYGKGRNDDESRGDDRRRGGFRKEGFRKEGFRSEGSRDGFRREGSRDGFRSEGSRDGFRREKPQHDRSQHRKPGGKHFDK